MGLAFVFMAPSLVFGGFWHQEVKEIRGSHRGDEERMPPSWSLLCGAVMARRSGAMVRISDDECPSQPYSCFMSGHEMMHARRLLERGHGVSRCVRGFDVRAEGAASGGANMTARKLPGGVEIREGAFRPGWPCAENEAGEPLGAAGLRRGET